MEFRQFYINMLLVAIIVLGTTGFIVGLQANYNVHEPIVNNSKVAYLTQLQGNVTAIGGNANASNTGFYSQSPQVDTGGLMLTTIVGAGKLLVNSIGLIYDIVVVGVAQSLGIDSSVMILLEAMLIGGLVLLIWSVIRLGR